MEKELLAKDKKFMQLRPHKNVLFCRNWGTFWAQNARSISIAYEPNVILIVIISGRQS